MPGSVSARRAAAMLSLCLPLWACQGGIDQLDEPTLGREVRALSSLCAEAAFVTAELRAGHLKASFVSVHLGNLAEDAGRALKALAKPAPPVLEQRNRATQAMTGQLLQALRDAALAQGGPDAQLARSEGRFRELKAGFDRLGGASR